MLEENKPNWWGYRHSNGTIQLKHWWGDHKDYTEDCENNPFVLKVVKPFYASDANEARTILEQRIGHD